jgi:hypothetical protein
LRSWKPEHKRKNWLFFQREGGGKTAAILMSLLMTAKAAGRRHARLRQILGDV